MFDSSEALEDRRELIGDESLLMFESLFDISSDSSIVWILFEFSSDILRLELSLLLFSKL